MAEPSKYRLFHDSFFGLTMSPWSCRNAKYGHNSLKRLFAHTLSSAQIDLIKFGSLDRFQVLSLQIPQVSQ